MCMLDKTFFLTSKKKVSHSRECSNFFIKYQEKKKRFFTKMLLKITQAFLFWIHTKEDTPSSGL